MIGKNEDGSWKKVEELTEREVRLLCNGCGAKGGCITPPYAAFFETSCNHHDYGYHKGGQEENRKICDDTLRAYMKKDCSRLPWYKWLRYRPWCELYYCAVRMFGNIY